MRFLVTGSAGHLGEAIVRTLQADPSHEVAGLDRLPSPFTRHVGSVADEDFVRGCARGVDVVIHAATLHKPHVATHAKRDFVETNVAGTLSVLEAALAQRVSAVVFSSTTSVYGHAMRGDEAGGAVWVDEALEPAPRNIYGVTKRAAEDLCALFQRSRGLPCVVLRIARFFTEADDDGGMRARFDDLNLKANEYLYRRLDLADAVEAHLLAARRAPELGFGRYVLSATTPFERRHTLELGADAPAVVRSLYPDFDEIYRGRGWSMLPGLDRVYDNRLAREALGWRPRVDFRVVLDRLARGESFYSDLAREVGNKGYHEASFADGPYPVEPEAADPS